MKKLLTRLALLMILCAELALPVFADAVTDSISVCIGYFGWSEDEYVEKAKFSWQELDDWYDDYGRTIDDYDIYDSDRLDEEDLTQLEWALDVRIDDNLVVACDVTYAGGADEDFYFEFVQVSGQWYLLFAMD